MRANLPHVDEAVANSAALGDSPARLQQIAEADEIQNRNRRQHRKAAEQARQAEQPLQRQHSPYQARIGQLFGHGLWLDDRHERGLPSGVINFVDCPQSNPADFGVSGT